MAGEDRVPWRWNLGDLDLSPVQAHGGEGLIRFARLLDRTSGDRGGGEAGCHFIDLAELPPGASIGRHLHRDDEEEFYLVLAGSGRMWRSGEEFDVRAGDVIRNPPGGEHGLVNTGQGPLRIFVFEVGVGDGG